MTLAMPVETKVKASTAAAALSGMALWALGRYVFKGAVPDVIASWTYVIIPALITFGAGYLAKHTDGAAEITRKAVAAVLAPPATAAAGAILAPPTAPVPPAAGPVA